MDNFSGKVAVITGGASGIGRAIAEACAARGMAIAIVDMAADKLQVARDSLRQAGARVEAYMTDVSDVLAMHALAQEVRASFGAVHLLVNNAGISGVHRWCWRFNDQEWSRMLDINLRGVVNGLQAFLPDMVDQQEGHIVNTSSVAGLMGTPMNAPYCATKFAIAGLSESLSLDLREAGSRIGVSVLCPAMIRTGIGSGVPEAAEADLNEQEQRYNDGVVAGLAAGMEPADVAEMVLDAVRENRFYIHTHGEFVMPLVQARANAIGDGSVPLVPQ